MAKSTTTAEDVRAAIRDRYVQGEYAVLFEVSDATGARGTRSADAVIMSCWPSRGLELWGVEIKVSRADWMHERRQPQKAETIAAYCDRWYLITGPNVIHDVSEIPPAWGWIELAPPAADLTGTTRSKPRLQLRKEAEKTEAKVADRLFLASVLRNASRLSDGLERQIRKTLVEEQEILIEERVQKEIERRRDGSQGLFDVVAAFERESGIQLDKQSTWGRLTGADGANIGRIVKALLDGGMTSAWGPLQNAASAAQRAADELTKAATSLGLQTEIIAKTRKRA